MILLDKSLRYCNNVINGIEATTPEVTKQCERFLQDLKTFESNDPSFNYYFDYKELEKVESLLKIMYFATGIGGIVGKRIIDGLEDFQCFILVGVFGFRLNDNPKKFKHRDITLFVPRKNAKTFIIAVVMILLMLTEQSYSEFYSISIDRSTAGELRKAIVQIIENSPALKKRFKCPTTLASKITLLLNKSFFQCRTSESGRNNAIRPACILADEVGNFTTYDNISAMKSGQLSVPNPLMFKTTTAYAINNSIMEEEIDYIRKVLDGTVEDDKVFALLYYAPEEEKWTDKGIEIANPLRIKENYDEIKANRDKALLKPSEQPEYLTKHVNLFVNADSKEKYLDMNRWRECRVSEHEFQDRVKGKEVVLALDLSISIDLTAVGIMLKDNDGKYYCHSHGFLPKNTLNDRVEKIDYYAMERHGFCTLCDGMTVNYTQVEQYIRNIEDKFGCKIKCIISDPFNAKQMLESLSNDYDVVELTQRFSTLSSPTKEFRNEVYNGNVHYSENKLLDWCVSCATLRVGQVEDVMLNKKYKNRERIDMLAVLIFAFKVLFEEETPINWDEVINDDWII